MVFDCPILQLVRDSSPRIPFFLPHLFQEKCRAVARWIWQYDLVAVFHLIPHAFACRRSILAAATCHVVFISLAPRTELIWKGIEAGCI